MIESDFVKFSVTYDVKWGRLFLGLEGISKVHVIIHNIMILTVGPDAVGRMFMFID